MWSFSLATASISINVVSTAGFQLLQRSPTPTSISTIAYHHGNYVDQKIQSAPYTDLNHQFWHQRNVVTSLPSSAQTSAASPAGASTSALSSVISDPRNPRLTESLNPSTSPAVIWENRNDFDCLAALSAKAGDAENPSGIAACYNVQGLDNVTGIFYAGLRLYHVAAPTGVWAQVKGSGVSIGINYGGASVTQQTTGKEKRDEAAAVWWSREEKQEGRQSLFKRSAQPPPRLLEDLFFMCTVHNGLVSKLNDSEEAYKILVPNVELSGTTTKGKIVTTSLTLSYVSDFFPKTANPSDETWTPEKLEYAKKLLGLTHTLAVFPVGFFITTVWAILLMSVQGYGTLQKIKSRDSYRRRVKRAQSNRPAKAYMETRSGIQFEDFMH